MVYDEGCRTQMKHLTMEMRQIGSLGQCQGNGCAEMLLAAGTLAATSAVVSGGIVVTGNVVYWVEKQGRCIASPVAG
jgi:hypothetical protein